MEITTTATLQSSTAGAGLRATLLSMALAGGIVAGGCTKTWRGRATQPNPLVQSTETLRTSAPIIIVTGDVDLRVPRTRGYLVSSSARYPLRNVATVAFVSRDRLRVHVQLEHKWSEFADAANWSAHLVVDRHRRYEPETVDRSKPKLVVQMWDVERRSVVRNSYGEIVGLRHDAHERPVPLTAITHYRGRTDFAFHARDIMTPAVESIRFVLERPGYRFVFSWSFSD